MDICSFYIMFAFGFQFIFSTAIDGKIKAWLYDNLGSRVDYDAPGKSCTRMLYSADGTRYDPKFMKRSSSNPFELLIRFFFILHS